MSRFVNSRPRYEVHKRRLAATRKALSFNTNSLPSKSTDSSYETVSESESDKESKSTNNDPTIDFRTRVTYFYFFEFSYKLANCKEDNFVSHVNVLTLKMWT